jgi:hypothetical protein
MDPIHIRIFVNQHIRFLIGKRLQFFTRLFPGFNKFQYPDYHDDMSLVNEYELKELDQLLAWCIEYDVHLQLAMAGPAESCD